MPATKKVLRRKFSDKKKAEIVAYADAHGTAAAKEKYNVFDSSLSRWRHGDNRNGALPVSLSMPMRKKTVRRKTVRRKDEVKQSRLAELERRIAALERELFE